MKKNMCILFALLFFGKTLVGQTLHTIDSLSKVQQACLDEGRYMIGCVAVYKKQLDSLVQLSLKKLYARQDKKANLALEKDQESWLEKQKIYNIETARLNHEQAVKDDYADSEIERISLLGLEADFIEKRARHLVKKLNKL